MDPYQDTVEAIVRDMMELIREYRVLRGLSCYALVARQSAHNLEDPRRKRPSLPLMVRLWLALRIPTERLAAILERHQ